MTEHELTAENWREYDFGGRVYRINNPLKVWLGSTTHRVWDGKTTHCVPAPGVNGCVLRWEPKDPTKPVQF